LLTSLLGLRRTPPTPFQFLDTGPLIDGDLELVQPRQDWVADVLAACSHPLTLRDAPGESSVTRSQLQHFLKLAPFGHEPGTPSVGRAPSYHFWMRWHDGQVVIAGGLGFRISDSASIELYYGHIGYHVYPPARGHHFAERACRLLFPLARSHGMRQLWITCNPDNLASRRTCERLGGVLIETVAVPRSEPLYQRGEREKCRFRIEL
jgi:predicted acetyltransferase